MGAGFKLNHVGISSVIFALALAAYLGLSATPALGQAATGTVVGQVTDQQNAAIAGADISLVDTATGGVRNTTSNEVGRYTIPSVPPGTYDMTVTKTGFTASKFSAQKVEVGQVLTLNVSMQVGATTTTVEVQATAGAELQTLNATVGTTITNESLNLLPNLARDASALSVYQPGVSLAGNVAGAATDQNSFSLDGGYNSDDMAGSNATYTPANGYAGTGSSGGTPSGAMPTPIESVEEFKVGTTGQSADFNSAAGSQVQMATKRGTNQFHGALYEYYFANNVGAANLWLNNHTKDPALGLPYTPLPKTHRNRFGGALGGPLLPKFWGGKTYFFVNYEGMRYPFSESFERASPTATMRAGVIMLPTANGNQGFNINTAPVTVNGTTYPGCGQTNSCDPRGLGVNPTVQKIWNTMPLPNDLSYTTGTPGDGYGNSGGYLANLAIPQNSDFVVGRIDHDFGDKWRLMTSYRYYNFPIVVSSQTDMGGLICGKSGSYCSTSPRIIKPDYWVAGLSTTISPNITNQFTFSFLRNFWQWFSDAGVPQFSNLGGGVELGGDSANALIPYNIDSQDVRTRFWDGHDTLFGDNISHLHGNHLFQYGGSYLRNYDYHSRNDNGVTIDTSIMYLAANGTGIPLSAYSLPPGVTSSALTNYSTLFDMATGSIVTSQVAYTRSGAALNLDPLGTQAFDQSIIPTYDAYWSDTWHLKPSLTFTYGVSYNLAMPAYEINGKQVQMVDDSGNPIDIKGYLNNRAKMAAAGQVYQPEIGFALIGNAGGGEHKYPYNPFYGGFSPHASLAWNPTVNDGLLGKLLGGNKTVIRGGYGRIYGRLNGVDLLLVPLLGPGLIQGVQCVGPLSNGTCSNGPNSTPATAFRIGVDGNAAPLPSASPTLPQPFFPGALQNGVVNAGAADGSQLDPNLRPDVSDEVDITVQRSLNSKIMLEVGYTGRKIGNEFQEINLDATPNMLTAGGQSFAQAYAAVYTEYCGLQGTSSAGVSCNKNTSAVTAQPFFENAMGGANSAYCAGFSSCTAAVISHEGANFSTTSVNTIWLDLGKSSSLLTHSMLEQPLGTGLNQQLTGAFDFINSYGHGSYNAGFVTLRSSDWHGVTAQSNFTYGRAIGTGSVVQASSSITVPDPFNFNNFGTYGVQPFDVLYTYSLLGLYQTPWYKSQKGFIGRVLGGWGFAPIFTARSGLPLRVRGENIAQSYGEIYSGQSANYEEAAGVSPYTGGGSQTGYYNYQNPSSSIATSENPGKGGSGLNIFQNPAAVAAEFRPNVLGIDQNSGGAGVIRGFPYWNLDATVSKDIIATERIHATFTFQFVNLLNHFVPADPSVYLSSLSTWGVVTNQAAAGNGTQSRWMEFGLRLGF
ncbi:MAG TPA: carboxypeptidase-like regulatory domain-containing protein [Bryobacteraceae bacterium]|nr:carboxypeptidase-like regulatory domain-containing protein [Bryobacteraceae bacterium]